MRQISVFLAFSAFLFVGYLCSYAQEKAKEARLPDVTRHRIDNSIATIGKARAQYVSVIKAEQKKLLDQLEKDKADVTRHGDLEVAMLVKGSIDWARSDDFREKVEAILDGNTTNSPAKAIVGTWSMTFSTGTTSEWTFETDGSIHDNSSGDVGHGTWELLQEKRQIVVTWSGGDRELIALPLDQQRFKGQSAHHEKKTFIGTKKG